MLITKTYHDVPSPSDNGKPIRIFVIAPTVPGYPQAKFPGRSAFQIKSEITHLLIPPTTRRCLFFRDLSGHWPSRAFRRSDCQPRIRCWWVGASGPLEVRSSAVGLTLTQRARPPITSLRVQSQFLMTQKVSRSLVTRIGGSPSLNCSQGRIEGITTRYPLLTDSISRAN